VIFRYSILYVADPERSLAFYERAFGLKVRMLHSSGLYGELDTGETTLAFSSFTLMQQIGRSPRRALPEAPVSEIAFETDDVASALKRAVEAGAQIQQSLREEPWGQITAYVTDPDGHLIELCSAVRPQS